MAAIDVDFSIAGSGPPIIFVHGIGGRRSGWDEIVRRLRKDFTCVTYDLRGHGLSPIPPVPYSLDELVEDLEALHTRLGLDKAHIIGHSLGGMIAPAYARAYPDRVFDSWPAFDRRRPQPRGWRQGEGRDRSDGKAWHL